MNQQSQFQIENPLSPKKFWKKFLSYCLSDITPALLLGFLIGAIAFLTLFFHKAFSPETFFASAIGGGVAIYAILLICQGAYLRAYIRNYFYDCSEDFVTIRKGVFTMTEIHVQYSKIQDVYVDQDFLDRLFGLYDVHISSATLSSGIDAHIDGVDQAAAESIRNAILSRIKNTHAQLFPAPLVSEPLAYPAAHAPASPAASGEISSAAYPVRTSWIFMQVAISILLLPVSIYLSLFVSNILSGMTAYYAGLDKLAFFSQLYFWVALCLMFFGFILYRYVWMKNYSFKLDADSLVFRTGIIALSEKHIPYAAVQNVTVRQGIVEKAFGLASVAIENAAYAPVQDGRGIRIADLKIFGQKAADAQFLADQVKQAILARKPASL